MKVNYRNFYLKTRNDYYEECLFPQDPKRFQDFICNEDNSITTSKKITFRDIPFLENEKNVISLFGKPRYIMENPYPPLPVKVIFYKEEIENIPVITQMHFFENKFFYAGYSFRRWTTKDLSFFKEIIFNKYTDKSDFKMLGETGDALKSNRIMDNNNNGLIIIPEVHLHFIYFSENIEIAKILQNVHMNEEESKMLKQKNAGKYF